MKGVLHITTAARARSKGAWSVAAVMRWNGAGKPRVAVRHLRGDDPLAVGYRTVLFALAEAGRAGARQIVLFVESQAIRAHLLGTERPTPEVLGLYVQVRALLNVFHPAEICGVEGDENHEAAFAAASALRGGRPVYADLPLWAAAS